MTSKTVGVLSALALVLMAGQAVAQEKLIFASYGGKSPENYRTHLFDKFTADTGIVVEQVIVPGKMLAGMQAQQETGNIQWDITTSLAAGDYATMSANDWLAEVPEDVRTALAPNFPIISEDGIVNKRGALLIVCNTKTAQKCPTTAAELIDVDNFPGTRFMPSFQALEALTFAAYASGVPADKLYPLDLDKAEAALNKIRPSIVQFYNNSTTARQLLASGEVEMGLLWNGTPSQIIAEGNVNVDLVHSWDGAVTYNQWTVVYKGAPNEENAWTFMKWMNDNPEAMAAYAKADAADVSHKGAFPMLPEEIREWSPEAERPETTLPVDTVWYMNDTEAKNRIDEFWKNYIN